MTTGDESLWWDRSSFMDEIYESQNQQMIALIRKSPGKILVSSNGEMAAIERPGMMITLIEAKGDLNFNEIGLDELTVHIRKRVQEVGLEWNP